MKNKLKQSGHLKSGHLNLALAAILSVFMIGCDNARFSQNDGANGGGGDPQRLGEPVDDLVFIDDSFERDDIFADFLNNEIFGWRGLVLTGDSDSFLGYINDAGAGMRIPEVGDLGPAGDLDRFLLFQGADNGDEYETLFLVSQSYDLSVYNSVILSFNYLTFGLSRDTGSIPKGLELQVCRGTLNDCGANDDGVSLAGQLSDNWVTVEAADIVGDENFDGRNHTVDDWEGGLAVIDLNNPEFVGSSNTFVFRFVATVRDGLAPGNCDGDDSDDDGGHIYRHTASDSKHKDDSDRKCKKHKCDKHKKCKKHKCDKHKKCKKHKCDKHKKCKKHKCDKHKKHCYRPCCPCECDRPEPCEPDGTLTEGAAIDKVKGVATQRTIDEIL